MQFVFARQQTSQRLHVGNVGKNVGSMKCRNLRVQTLVLPTMPTLPIGFRFVFDFYVFARTNRKPVGIVGIVGNSTHLHIAGITTMTFQKTCRRELQGSRVCAVL